MACYNQYKAKEKVSGKVVPIPCGKCIGCRLEKARQWAVRCYHESQMYTDNCFVTLTYNNEHLPESRNIEKRTLQLFFKRLRKHINKHEPEKEIRFYACGEYGEKMGRPHYHSCIFNYDFPDKEILYTDYQHNHRSGFSTGINHSLYTSATLEKIWGKGYCTIGELNLQTAGYVARYVTKKITGPLQEEHYKRDYMEPGAHKAVPEFALMSRMPGIGEPWLQKYFTDVYPKDFFTINGIKNKPPRYYDDLLKKRDPKLHLTIKKARAAKAEEEEVIRLKQLENHKKLTIKSLNRGFENETT